MKRTDKIRLSFIRNWNLPGKERLSHWFKPSARVKAEFYDGITWLTTDDIAIYTTADNYIEWTILNSGTYEDEIGKLIKISLNPGDAALDIGGNIGLQSLRMSLQVTPTGKVLAFEPLEFLQEKFKSNQKLNKADNITLLPFALSDNAAEVEYQIDKNTWNQGTFSLGNTVTGADKQKIVIKIGDEIPEIQTLAKLSLIKIDVEGYEHQVLQGLNKTIIKHKPRIIFEYDKHYWAATKQDILSCYNFLVQLNYKIYQISPVGCELINAPQNIQSGNLFCVNND